MKQLVILSGKGGTGKTAVTASLAHLANADEEISGIVLADADVDAANLEILVGGRREKEEPFPGGSIAVVDPDICTGCGICQMVCRFGAIDAIPEAGIYQVNPIRCEGCASCYFQCPEEAIRRVPQTAGRWFRSISRYGTLFHARLRPAQDNSGKLVTLVKEEARKAAVEAGLPLVIVDGPPGIGCPAIAAATDSSLALIVTEPTVSGIHDMERALEMTRIFKIPAVVAVNKADLNPEGREQIERRCRELGVEALDWIPFDEKVTEALMAGRPITDHAADSPAGSTLLRIWKRLKNRLDMGG